jgi:hypothetical protein
MWAISMAVNNKNRSAERGGLGGQVRHPANARGLNEGTSKLSAWPYATLCGLGAPANVTSQSDSHYAKQHGFCQMDWAKVGNRLLLPQKGRCARAMRQPGFRSAKGWAAAPGTIHTGTV